MTARAAPLTMPERAEDTEQAYRRHVAALMARRVRIAALTAAGVTVFDTSITLATLDSVSRADWMPRLAALGVVVTTYLAARRWEMVRFGFVLSLMLGLVMVADLMAQVLRTGGAASPYWSAGGVLLVAVSLFFPYSDTEVATVSAVFGVSLTLPLFLADVPNQWRNWPVEAVILGGSALCALVGTHFGAKLRRSEFFTVRALAREQERSERLLLNILPREIAERLKDDQRSVADGFAEVTILFADIAGFTRLSTHTQPERLVEFLNEVFSRFDALAERHGLEKIKTIGDAYMVAGGLPTPREDHARAVAEMALDMREAAGNMKTPDGTPLSIRIGLNSGPVVAGVIGTKKFVYDLWGDAVNIAARMESHGEPGAIHVTDATRELLAGAFVFDDRGTIEVKGKGPMRTFFLVGRTAGSRRGG